MMTFGLIFLAAFFNAVHDIVNFRFHESVFRNWNQDFWNNNVSYLKAKKVFGYKIDAFHISKSLMLVCLFLAAMFYSGIFGWWDFAIMGGVWNLSFNLYYKILRK